MAVAAVAARPFQTMRTEQQARAAGSGDAVAPLRTAETMHIAQPGAGSAKIMAAALATGQTTWMMRLADHSLPLVAALAGAAVAAVADPLVMRMSSRGVQTVAVRTLKAEGGDEVAAAAVAAMMPTTTREHMRTGTSLVAELAGGAAAAAAVAAVTGTLMRTRATAPPVQQSAELAAAAVAGAAAHTITATIPPQLAMTAH